MDTNIYAKLQIWDEYFHIQSDAEMRTSSNEMQRVGGFQRRCKLIFFPSQDATFLEQGVARNWEIQGSSCVVWLGFPNARRGLFPVGVYNKIVILGLGGYDLT